MAKVIINIPDNDGTAIIPHNLLDGLQGGAPNEYFHLTQEEYENLPSILDIPIKTSQLLNDGEDGINSFITLNDLPSPLGLDGVLNVGNTALDKTIILNSTPDDSYDIFKSELIPGASTHTSKEVGSLVTHQSFYAADSLSFTDGAEVAGIVPSLYLNDPEHIDGSVIGNIIAIPPKVNPLLSGKETIATREWVNVEINKQDIDETLGNGDVALDKTMTLDSTPDDVYDIRKTELVPGVTRNVSKEVESSKTYYTEVSGTGVAFYAGDIDTAQIIPTLDGSGNIVASVFKLPPTTGEEIGATREWINSQGFINNVITSLGYTPANKAGETFTGSISAINLSGVNTGDNAPNSNYASDYRASNFIADTDYLTPNTANSLFDFKPVVYNKTTNLPIIGSPTINNVEGLSILATGPVARNFADTNLFTRTQRLGLITSTTSNLAQIRQTSLYFSGNTGYEVIFKFGFSDNATDTAIRAFIGLSTNTIFSNVEPDTLLNCIAVGRLSTSNNLHLIYNDNTGTATTVDLGSNFPANTINTDVYLVKFVTVAGSNSISVYIERQNTGNTYTTTLTTDIPALSQGLNFGGYIVDTTGANTSTGIDFMGMYVKN